MGIKVKLLYFPGYRDWSPIPPSPDSLKNLHFEKFILKISLTLSCAAWEEKIFWSLSIDFFLNTSRTSEVRWKCVPQSLTNKYNINSLRLNLRNYIYCVIFKEGMRKLRFLTTSYVIKATWLSSQCGTRWLLIVYCAVATNPIVVCLCGQPQKQWMDIRSYCS